VELRPGIDNRESVLARLVLVLLGNGLLRVAAGAIGVLAGLYLAQLAGTGSTGGAELAGSLGAVSFATGLVGSIPMGLASDALAPRVLMTLGALLGALGMQIFGFSLLTAVLFVGRGIEGLGAAASAPAILAHLTDLTGHDAGLRAKVMSYFEITLLGGLALGGLAGGELWRWEGRGAFAWVAILYGLASLLLYFGGAGSKGYGGADALIGLKRAVGSASLRRLAPVWLCANALVGLWLGPTVSFLLADRAVTNQFLSGVFADDPRRVGWVTFAFAMIFGTGVVTWGFILPRVNMFRAMKVALLGMLGVCLGLYAMNHSSRDDNGWRWAAGVFASACVMVESGFTPAALSMLAGIVGAQAGRGAAMGIYSVLLSLGAILGSLIAGWLGGRLAMDGIILGTIAMGVLAMLLLIKMEREERHA
jgi:MFS family permease